jgi:hypothetical protein
MERIVGWFSCGAASATAIKLAIEENRKGRNLPLVVVRCYVAEEHPDNNRFAADCEKWFGVPILTVLNGKFGGSIYEVFRQRKYISGIHGAPCTLLLKKEVREKFQQPGDIHVFGYTADEEERRNDFIDANADVKDWPILIEKGLQHADTLALVERAGIELPTMYKLGFKHNNCIGCAKATGAGYWNRVRIHFPNEFNHMAQLSRQLGARMTRIGEERIFLDELPEGVGDYESEPEIQCGIFCHMAEREMAA